MSKMYTEKELLEMGITKEQIEAVVSSDEEVERTKNIIKIDEAVKRPTSIEELKKQSRGELVELPGFIKEESFVARLRRPSLLVLIESGQIPNDLLAQAQNLFSNGTADLANGGNASIKEMYDVIKIICKSAMVEPTYSELEENEIQLTDEQLMAIFAYTQRGIKAMESFR